MFHKTVELLILVEFRNHLVKIKCMFHASLKRDFTHPVQCASSHYELKTKVNVILFQNHEIIIIILELLKLELMI